MVRMCGTTSTSRLFEPLLLSLSVTDAARLFELLNPVFHGNNVSLRLSFLPRLSPLRWSSGGRGTHSRFCGFKPGGKRFHKIIYKELQSLLSVILGRAHLLTPMMGEQTGQWTRLPPRGDSVVAFGFQSRQRRQQDR
ncbi:hypothetical protein BM221_010053 [Beauveria bassiana]|uniref:Uncharacterized protein n=1 Tax=Beauveria bassiana TaxID=176275 RepID=A0A2N6NAG1_BEABA|nr:hypothetical protein BM221_010053 [Beauveria bassiana]